MESAIKVAQGNTTALQTKLISSIAETLEFISQLLAFDLQRSTHNTRRAQDPSSSSFLLFLQRKIDN